MRAIKHKNLKWIDILVPKDEDIKLLEKFGFHHLILEEIKTPTYHPLIESYRKYLYLILHFPDFDSVKGQILPQEIDFLITESTLITVRYKKFDDFEEIFQEVQSRPGKYLGKTTGHLLYNIIKKLFQRTFPELNRIQEAIDKIEENVLNRFDENVIESIASTKNSIIDFLRAIKPQKVVWDAIREVAMKFWGSRMKPYVSDMVADYNRILYFAETHREILDSLHMTSSSLLDNKRNYVIKILTIFTAIILPLSLFASIYGMNLVNLPLAAHPDAFWFFLGGMSAVIAGMLIYFRVKKWL
ncbi:MAG: magnesium transporter CorA family protein [Patescibacteria group bacterium]